MSTPCLPTLRPAGRSAQLLRLVHDASVGLPSTSRAGAIWAARSVSTSARFDRVSVAPGHRQRQVRLSKLPEHRSYGATAYALGEPERQSPPQLHHSRFTTHSNQSSSLTAPTESVRTTYPSVLIPSDWTEPPIQIQELLRQPKITPLNFRSAFENAICEPYHLARISTLEVVWKIWQEQAGMSSWAWLAGQLSHIPKLSGKDELETGLIPMVEAINGYALVMLQNIQTAQDELDCIRRSRSKGGVYAALIQAMAWVRLNHPDNAKRHIGLALRQMLGTAKDEVKTRQLVDMLEELVMSYRRGERWDDLLDIIVGAGGSLRTLILSMSDSKPLPKPDVRMAEIWMDVLASCPDPVRWISGRLEGSNKDMRWMGALFLTALARKPEDIHRCSPLIELVISHELPFPATRAAKLLSISSTTHADDTATQLVNYLSGDLSSLPHLALSALLDHAARSHDTSESRRIWSTLVEHFVPTLRDKSNFLSRVSNTSDPAEMEVQLKQFFGSSDHPEALSLRLSSHILENDIETARQVFDKLVAVRPGIQVINKMLGLYAANADADSAVRLFDDIGEHGFKPTLHSYTSLISLFANTRDVENARNVFGLMVDAGVKPDAAAYSAILNAEVEGGEWSAAADRWDSIPPYLQHSNSILSVILKAYVLLSIPTSRIIDIFRRAKRPNAYLWSLAMQSAVDNDDFPLASELLTDMKEGATQDPTSPYPGVYHFSILLHGYMQTGRRTEARATYEDMIERNIIPSSVTYGMIMSAFREVDGRSGLEQAVQFAASINLTARQLSEVPRGRATGRENLYGPLITMSGGAGRTRKAEEYVELASPEQPTVRVYTRLMDAYRQAGQTNSAMAIWERAFELACNSTRKAASNVLGGVATSRVRDNILCIPLSIALDSLAAAGRYADVRRIWDSVQDAGFGFDAQNYNHYATALARTGDVDRAFSIVENVLLPRWEEVKSRRVSVMRESAFGLLPPPTTPPPVYDIPAQPPARTDNRRHEIRFGASALNSDRDDNPTGVDSEILRHWRPSDALWRPSLLTISVLEHAYSQVQDANRAAWIALGSNEEDGEPDDQPRTGEEKGDIVRLPSFGQVPIRDAEGEVKRTTPRAVLFRLNRKYVKTVALVMFHRRKRAAKRLEAR